MDGNLVSLILANVAFVGTHFVMSHPLRAPLIRLLGELGFMIAYSLVAFATLGWVAHAFGQVEGNTLAGSGAAGWIAASVITLIAIVLLCGSFAAKNPALPMPGAEDAARKEPAGIFRVTRHPMMWSIALWAIAHILLWWSWRTNVVALAMLILALAGSALQDGKKRQQMGEAWAEWSARTSYWPRWAALLRLSPLLWLVAIAVWAAATYAHIHAGGVPAGLWRWI